jgi:hypothetical protein
MADNTDEGHLDNPTSTQSENLSDKVILINDTETITQTQETENMEVHKHPHHVTHKKKWGEYLLEFLMLFLAVFLGFVAENIREHNVEREREKEYVESLIADLKSDQQILAQHIAQVKSGLSMTDSMIVLLNRPSLIAGSTGQLYYFARFGPRLKPLSINNRTLEQLKNSGNFRLIKNLSTSNKIMSYYDQLPLMHLLESISETEFTEYKKVAVKIFDPSVFLKMEDENGDVKRIADNPPLRNLDNELLQELSAFSVYMQADKKTIIKISNDLKTQGAELLEYLKNEYHLE